jgi:hypothetical protein
LIEDSQSVSNFGLPNFRTVLPLPVLLRGLCTLLDGLYQPDAFFARALRSIESWQPRSIQAPPNLGWLYNLRVLCGTVWCQGIRSNYRRSYWSFFGRMLVRCVSTPAKLWLGFTIMLSAHHFVQYSQVVIRQLRLEADLAEHADLALEASTAG